MRGFLEAATSETVACYGLDLSFLCAFYALHPSPLSQFVITKMGNIYEFTSLFSIVQQPYEYEAKFKGSA